MKSQISIAIFEFLNIPTHPFIDIYRASFNGEHFLGLENVLERQMLWCLRGGWQHILADVV